MVSVHRSETGTFVLVDSASGITVTGESLEEAWTRLQESVGDAPSAPGATTPHKATPRGMVALVVLALLPFAWLLLASDTIEQTLEESRAIAAASDSDARADDPTVIELKRLSKKVSALQRKVDKLEKGGSRSRSKDKDAEPEDAEEPDADDEADEADAADEGDNADDEAAAGTDAADAEAAGSEGSDEASLEATRNKLRGRAQKRRDAAAKAGEAP